MNLKKWGIVVAVYLVIFAVVVVVQEYVWRSFTIPTEQIVIANSKDKALKMAAKKNVNCYQGWQVPYNYRLGYDYEFQIIWQGNNKYRVSYIFNNAMHIKKVARTFAGTYFDNTLYVNQNFYVNHHGNRWFIGNKGESENLVNSRSVKNNHKIQKRAVIKSSKKEQTTKKINSNSNAAVKLPTTTTRTSAMQYFTENQKLYVTYDNKKNKVLVPNGYSQVFIMPNNSYDETLNAGSYIITPEFTAFVGYRKNSTGILYSIDKGKHWSYSKLKYNGFRGKAFISITNDRVYVTYATDESLGTDYYATFFSSNMKIWSEADFPKSLDQSNVTLVYWDNDNLVYYASKLGGFNFSDDGGENMRTVTLDFPSSIENMSGGNPFTVPSAMYTKQGRIYLIMSQSENGDYAQNNQLMEAVMVKSLDLGSFDYESQQAEK